MPGQLSALSYGSGTAPDPFLGYSPAGKVPMRAPAASRGSGPGGPFAIPFHSAESMTHDSRSSAQSGTRGAQMLLARGQASGVGLDSAYRTNTSEVNKSPGSMLSRTAASCVGTMMDRDALEEALDDVFEHRILFLGRFEIYSQARAARRSGATPSACVCRSDATTTSACVCRSDAAASACVCRCGGRCVSPVFGALVWSGGGLGGARMKPRQV